MASSATLILLLAIALLILEIFVPSGGVLGVLSALSFIAAILNAFVTDGVRAGTMYLLAVSLCLPPLIYAMIKLWPKTYIGRRILNQPAPVEERIPEAQRNRRDIVGHVGIALTDLLPAGAIRINGRSIDATSDGMSIEKGAAVEVIAVRGTHLIVRPSNRSPVMADSTGPAVESVQEYSGPANTDSAEEMAQPEPMSSDPHHEQQVNRAIAPPEAPTLPAETSKSPGDASDRSASGDGGTASDKPTEAPSEIDHRLFDEEIDDLLPDQRDPPQS